MTPEDQKRLLWLCQQIQEEKDRDKFTALVVELNELLQREEMRFTSNADKAKSASPSGSPSVHQRRN